MYVDAGPNQVAGLGRPVRLDASRSTSVGTITAYEWDLNGDGIYEVNVSSPVYESPGWTQPGEHQVALRATDDGGRNATAGTVITVVSGALMGINDAFEVSLSPNRAATSPGGDARFAIDLFNDQTVSDSLDLNLTGVETGWISLPESVDLASGESSQVALRVSVPENAPDANHTLLLRAFSRNLGGSKEMRASLNVTSAPMISDLLPEDSARTGSEEVLVAWKTAVNASSDVFIRSEVSTNFRRVAGAPAEEHAVKVGGLSRNSLYEYYVRSETPRGASQSDVRRIFIDNGIAFDQKVYNFSIERDYNQSVFIGIKNTDTKPHELLMQVSGVPQDLALNFVGEGSVDQRIALLPGEARSIELAFHAQDALSKEYSILLNLTNLGAEPITDSAVVNLKVHFPVIDYSIEEVKSDPYTLAKTLRITNRGDPLSDLSVSASRGLADLLVFSPSVDHAYIGTGQSLESVAEPVLYEGFTGAEGTITASAARASRNLSVQFAVPPGKSIFVGQQPNASIKFARDYDEDGISNTNPLDEAVDSYLFRSERSSQLAFIAKIKVNVEQNGQPAYKARAALRLTNESGSTISNSTTDQWGNALFTISGPLGEYSYAASVDGYGASTGTRSFTVRQTSSRTIEPKSIIWMSASDANNTLDLTSSDSSNISLGAPPFVIRASKAGLADDATPLLYLDDWAGYCDTEVIGESSGDEITFDLGYVDPGNYTAYIATQSSEGLATSSARTISFSKGDADILLQNNYTYEMPYPINASSVGKLTVENSQLASDPHKAARLLCVIPDENKSNYIFTYAIVSDRNMTDTLRVEAKDKNGRIFFQESQPVNLSRLSPLFVDVSVPAQYEDGTRVESLDVSVKMDDPLFLLAVLAIGLAGSATYIEYNDPGALQDKEAWSIFWKDGVLTPHDKKGVFAKCFASFVPGVNGLMGWFDLVNNVDNWVDMKNIMTGGTDLAIDPILDVTKGNDIRTGVKEWQFWKVREEFNKVTHSQTVQVRLYEYFKDIDPSLAGSPPTPNLQPGWGRQWKTFKEEYTKPLSQGRLSNWLTKAGWGLNAFSNIDDMIRVLDEQNKEAKAGLKQTQNISVKSCINHAPLKNKFETPGYIPRSSPGAYRSPSASMASHLVVQSFDASGNSSALSAASASENNIDGVYVRLFFAREPPEGYRPFNTAVRLNGHVIGSINDTVPRGYYVFRADPSWLNYAERGAAENTVTLDVDGMNRGYYVPLDGYKIDILFKSMQRAVCASNQDEADEAVQNLSGAMVHQADLAVTSHDLRISPQIPVQDENATIEATVHNLGSMGALDVEVQFLDNDRLIYTHPFLFLAEYSQEKVSFPWQPKAGAHNIKVVINPRHSINESDYSNNEAARTITATGPDSSRPAIGNMQPPDGSTVAYNLPLISADLSDEGSGINANSVRISVDGADVTDKATATTSRVWYTPVEPLSTGSHQLQVKAQDLQGNELVTSWSFAVSSDSTPPEIVTPQPPDGATVGEARPLISAALKDAGTGLNRASVKMDVDGLDVTSQATILPNKVWYTPDQPMAEGEHSIEVKVEDNQGNEGSLRWSFLMKEGAGPVSVPGARNLTSSYTGNLSQAAGPSVLMQKLSGDWAMMGESTGVQNSDWAARLTLKPDGTLIWIETEGATPGATRAGTWDYDGTTIVLKWMAPTGGQTAWISTSVKDNSMEDGAYTAENAPAGTWSASRSVSSGNDQMTMLQGVWSMEGRTTGVQNSDWRATLILDRDGKLDWQMTEGATVGSTRTGNWEFDGTTLTLRWMAPNGGQTVWTSAFVTDQKISDGTYTAGNAQEGTWSASRSGSLI
ncbi:MAG TPA: CARDB domain-containing protein [Methanotrichaceae archaeon]|nr:CARDB domain-containing protein [Methanotrichaceae archaeon]